MRIVLLHGLGVGPDYLRPLAAALRLDTTLPALPGWRGGPEPDHVLDLVELGASLEPLLPAAVVANSMGCQVAVELAIRRPELVPSLVLVGPTLDPYLRPWRKLLSGFALDCLREPPSLWWLIARDYAAMGPVRFAKTAADARRHRIEERLPLVRAPTLVVRGERDGFVSRRWCEEAAALLPHGRLAVIRGAAHAAHYSHPSLVAQEVEQHLREG